MRFAGFASADAAHRAAGVAFDAVRPWLARHRRTKFVAGPKGMLEAERDGHEVRLTLRGVPVGRLIEPASSAAEGDHGFELALPPGTGASTIRGARRVVDGALEAHAAAMRVEGVARRVAPPLEPHRMALPPPRSDAIRATDAPSTTAVVAQAIFGALVVFASLTVVAIAPIAISLLLAAAGGIGLLAYFGRRRSSNGDGRHATSEREPSGPAGWAALGLLSVVLLLLALVVPDGADVVLATLGVIGLVVLRLGAPRTHADRERPSDAGTFTQLQGRTT